jgi:acetolactate synthase-1/2/3 large subunit
VPDAATLLSLAAARLAGPGPGERWSPPADELVDRVRSARRPLLLAGPGVVRDGVIAGLHALAVGASVGVLNTWGAKGIFDWRSRHHLATVGLQELDAELGGVGDCDLLVRIGVDELESPPARWRAVDAVDVPTDAVAPLAELWSRPWQEIPMPPLRQRLAAATQSGWAVGGAPLAPSQATRNYGEVVAAGGVVAADPGLTGFWVARTLGTTRPGAVHVPAERDTAGLAVAIAVTAAERGLPALAVVEELTPTAQELLAATSAPLTVDVWDPEGERLDADGHRARLAERGVRRIATRPDQLDAFLEAAGDITAWK